MIFNPDIHHRHSIRLKGYDYSKGGTYFLTVCTWQRECLFGEILNGEIRLNEFGSVLSEEWYKSTNIRKVITLDAFIVMPNHLHGIVCISYDQPVGATGRSPLQNIHGPSKRSLGSFIAGFKSVVTKRINEIRNDPGHPVWQRNYYEHVIRSDESLNRIRDYIINNPCNWETDIENPERRDGIKAEEYYRKFL